MSASWKRYNSCELRTPGPHLNLARRRLVRVHLQRVRSEIDLVGEHNKLFLQALLLSEWNQVSQEGRAILTKSSSPPGLILLRWSWVQSPTWLLDLLLSHVNVMMMMDTMIITREFESNTPHAYSWSIYYNQQKPFLFLNTHRSHHITSHRPTEYLRLLWYLRKACGRQFADTSNNSRECYIYLATLPLHTSSGQFWSASPSLSSLDSTADKNTRLSDKKRMVE